jgi:septum site-determining protein MinD
MAKVLVVTSGKGGAITTTAAVGRRWRKRQKVVVVDFDVGLRNLDLFGRGRRVCRSINVVQGVAKLSQALIRDKRLENLYLLPASQTATRTR